MSCNSCAKSFNLIRKEKGCPGCGFSYCSKCLVHTTFLKKINATAKVCMRCKNGQVNSDPSKVDFPMSLKRLASLNENTTTDSKDLEIKQRLEKLKEGQHSAPVPTQQEIEERLKRIKDVPVSTDAEIQERLRRLRGEPTLDTSIPTTLPAADSRSQQQQADELLSQCARLAAADARYDRAFAGRVGELEARLGALRGGKGAEGPSGVGDEDDDVRKIIEKCKREAILEDSPTESPDMEELPFCEICNEDATLRCLGCRYLFCKRCYLEHKDDDDGCNRYEPYKPTKKS